MSAIAITTVKNAIRAWVISGSGLAANRVIWTLGARAPAGTYIHMRIRVGTVGADWVDTDPNPTPTSGNDATNKVRGGRIMTLTLTCFSADDVSAGTRSPEEILNDVLTAATLPSVSVAINAAKIGLLSFGEVTPVDLTIDSVYFEPRAFVTVRFHTVASLSETGPSIDSATVQGTAPAGTFTFLVDTTP